MACQLETETSVRMARSEMGQFTLTASGAVLFKGKPASTLEIMTLKNSIARFEGLLRKLYVDEADEANEADLTFRAERYN